LFPLILGLIKWPKILKKAKKIYLSRLRRAIFPAAILFLPLTMMFHNIWQEIFTGPLFWRHFELK
jgi:hypothetical protein